MSFLKRLTNLGKGMALAKKNSPPAGSVVDEELARDEANPRPGAAAEAELARLKTAHSEPRSTEVRGTNAKAEPSEASKASVHGRDDDPVEGERDQPRSKKTL